MHCIDVAQFKDKVPPDAEGGKLKIENGERVRYEQIYFSYQTMNFGGKRRYFICPYCGKRAVKLYITDDCKAKCRECAGVNPYKGIQNTTKGGEREIAYRMKRYGERHGINVTFPFDYTAFVNDPRCKKDSFRRDLKILQALEAMRFRAAIFERPYTREAVQRVQRGEHPLLEVHTLEELRRYGYGYVWDKTGGCYGFPKI